MKKANQAKYYLPTCAGASYWLAWLFMKPAIVTANIMPLYRESKVLPSAAVI